ncbi:PREDICTED: uncharacterized protein LOC109359706 [Lupinus angustifolius]|uniref:uncharacterized protein LOC109359706 n=1 Tax=Lupinus angustifolius TaxID=3871 RepID=UPI00092E78D8|nr:PREDICTED: uncharacterized protein LOC109359706 [Lupinus angustifolius]
MFLLHQCVDEAHFEKIAEARSAKEAWEILEKSNEGAEQLKKLRLQTVRRQYELMQMEPNERIAQYFNRVNSHTNAMKANGEKMTNQTIVEKILRTLSPKFDHIVVAIEESKKIDELKIMDLQGSLEAHEQRILEISTEKPMEQALQAQTTRRGGYGSRGGQMSRGRGMDQRRGNFKSSQLSDQERSETDQAEFSSRRGGHQRWQNNKRKAPSNQYEKQGKHHSEAYLAKKESTERIEDEAVLLMMATNNESDNEDKWYIDSGCSNHMTGKRNWLVNFDEQKRCSVRFADSRMIQAEGTCDVLISRKDGRNALISDVLYVPNMKSNLLSIGQLIEKGFSFQMHQGMAKIFDVSSKLILKAPLA